MEVSLYLSEIAVHAYQISLSYFFLLDLLDSHQRMTHLFLMEYYQHMDMIFTSCCLDYFNTFSFT